MSKPTKTTRDRIEVQKTWKLFIGGAFPRSESGRTTIVLDSKGRELAHVCRASRKDLREAVEKATTASAGWAARSAYNRGQILYRLAEMAEGRADEFINAMMQTGLTRTEARNETNTSVDRLVSMAGWTDKIEQVLGCRNPVAGPYHNMTIPEPIGVVGVIAPRSPGLLGLVSLIAPAIASGNTVVALGSENAPIPTLLFGELCATSDVPGGVVNLLTGKRSELLSHFSMHRGFNALIGAGLSKKMRTEMTHNAIDSMTRTHLALESYGFDDSFWTSPAVFAPFIETKTMWHPVGG